MALLTPGAVNASNINKKNPQVTSEISGENQSQYKNFEIGAEFSLHDPDGNLNFLRFIFPIYVELGVRENLSNQAKIVVPYEYAEKFKNVKMLNEEDISKMEAYLTQEVKKVFADVLYGLAIHKDTYKKENHLDVHQYLIDRISIVGFSSPEGKTSKSLQEPDVENMKLALYRALDMQNSFMAQLEKLGFSESQIVSAMIQSQGFEDQFSEDEMKELLQLAENYPEKNVLDKVFNLIMDYNDDKINSSETNRKLDDLIASKRRVEITIQYHGDQKEVLLIPVPLLILLLPLLKKIPKSIPEEGRIRSYTSVIKHKTPQPDPDARNIDKTNPDFEEEVGGYEELESAMGEVFKSLETQYKDVMDDFDQYMDIDSLLKIRKRHIKSIEDYHNKWLNKDNSAE